MAETTIPNPHPNGNGNDATFNSAQQAARGLAWREKVAPRCGLGVDSAQGDDNTSWCVCDDLGILDLLSHKTVDTTRIVDETISLMHRWNVPPDRVCFDAGGGG